MVPTVTMLTTGVQVVNFSSPHQFKFDDGSVLPACSPERSKALMLEPVEVNRKSDCGRYWIIDLEFRMTDVVKNELELCLCHFNKSIILVPLPVLQLTRDWNEPRILGCRVADRVSKTIHHDRFCR